MKSVRLAQIFCPAKETNRTHSQSYVEDSRAQAGRKQMHQDGSAEFISASQGSLVGDNAADTMRRIGNTGTPPPLRIQKEEFL